MDQKRLLAAIALSIGILLLFELWNRPAREAQLRQQQEASQQAAAPRPSAPEVPVPPGPLGAVTPPTGERSPAIGACSSTRRACPAR